jgi:hypothetical protein
MALVAGIRTWQIGHTEVISRDGLAFMRYAWQLEHEPWGPVLRGAPRHPGYPLAILAVLQPVRHFLSLPDSEAFQLSAQIASALASVLIVIPMYLLGRELFDRFVAFWACALFQCLPSASPVMADGLSEGVYLLFAAAALLAAARGLRRGRAVAFAGCGVFGALAYLVRPEGALVPAATGLVLIAVQIVPAWRWPWRRAVACGLSLVLSALAIGGPYVAVIGRLTVKPAARAITEGTTGPGAEEILSPLNGEAEKSRLAARDGSAPQKTSAVNRVLGGGREVVKEIGEGSFHVGWFLALLGLWYSRHRFRFVPGAWVLGIVCGVMVLLLWRLAAVHGYTSDRHLLLVILCGTYWAVVGVRSLSHIVADRASPRLGTPFVTARVLAPALLLIFLGAGLPKCLASLHADRAGFREAGRWLAEHSTPDDLIIDPYNWASFYSGRLFTEEPSGAAPGSRRTSYVVLPSSVGENSSRRAQTKDADRLRLRGQEVFRTAAGPKGQGSEVIVYAVSRRKPK